MKVKDFDLKKTKNKNFNDRKIDAMNWHLASVKICLKFLKKFAEEKDFDKYHDSAKQLCAFCQKFRRTVGAIKSEEIQSIVKGELSIAFNKLELSSKEGEIDGKK